MLLLLFYLGEDRYAIDSSLVVEIIPTVTLRPLHQVPQYVVGLFNYRGKIVPVLDLCQLIQGNPCRHCLSTRIIMVKYSAQDHQNHYLGLMAERVTDTLNKSESEFIAPELQSENTAFLGEVIMDGQGMIQRIRLKNLLSQSQQTWLPGGGIARD